MTNNNNELRQILSLFDDMETNFSAPATRGPSLAFCFSFQGYILNGPLEPGYFYFEHDNDQSESQWLLWSLHTLHLFFFFLLKPFSV